MPSKLSWARGRGCPPWIHERFEEVYAMVWSSLCLRGVSLFSFGTSDPARESLGVRPCVCYTSARLDDLCCLRKREQVSHLVSSARSTSSYVTSFSLH